MHEVEPWMAGLGYRGRSRVGTVHSSKSAVSLRQVCAKFAVSLRVYGFDRTLMDFGPLWFGALATQRVLGLQQLDGFVPGLQRPALSNSVEQGVGILWRLSTKVREHGIHEASYLAFPGNRPAAVHGIGGDRPLDPREQEYEHGHAANEMPLSS